MTSLLDRLAHPDSRPDSRPHPRHHEHQERVERPEVPLLEMADLSADDSKKLAKIVRELRLQAEDMPGLTERVLNSFKKLIVSESTPGCTMRGSFISQKQIERWAIRRQKCLDEDDQEGSVDMMMLN